MIFVFDYLKGNVGTGLLIGVGVLILAPVVLPVVAAILKITTKTVIKTGETLYEIGSDTVGGVVKIVEDIVSETKSELAGEQEVEEITIAGGEEAKAV